MDNSYDYLFKIVIIGDKRVGKSSLIKRFRENTYEEGSLSPTIGIDFHLKDVEINGKQTKVRAMLCLIIITEQETVCVEIFLNMKIKISLSFAKK